MIYDNLGDSGPHPPKQHNHNSAYQHNTRPLRAIHHCGMFCFYEVMNLRSPPNARFQSQCARYSDQRRPLLHDPDCQWLHLYHIGSTFPNLS